MKKILLVFTTLLMGFFAQASNNVDWKWSAMSPINQYTFSVYCKPLYKNVMVDLEYDVSVPSGTPGRVFRSCIELKNGSGSTFTNGWVNCSSGYPAGSTGTYYQPTQSILVNSSGTYTATITIQYSPVGLSGPWYSFTTFNSSLSGPKLTFNSNNDATTFTVNGKAQNGNGAPPEIVLCNGEVLKIDGFTNLGTYNKIETGIESGNYDPSAAEGSRFISNPKYRSDYFPFSSGLIYLSGTSSKFHSWWMVSTVRYVKVTVKVYGPCDPAPGYTTKEMIFKVIDAAAFVNFEMMANGSCSPIIGIARQTTLPIPNASFTSAPCIPGWQGAATAGIISFNTVGSTDPINSYNVKIEEVDPFSGSFISTILDQTVSGGLPLNYQFITPTSGYFLDPANYASLSTTNRTFKATLTVNTDKCSNSNFSYFRIAASNRFYKMTESQNVIAEVSINNPVLYPNPSNDKVTIRYSNLTAASSIVIFDNLGKKVLSQENLGANGASIDIQNLSNGIYFYTLTSGTEIFHGKLSKN